MLILGVEPRIPAYKTSVITVSLYELRWGKLGIEPRTICTQSRYHTTRLFSPSYYYQELSLSIYKTNIIIEQHMD